VSASKIVHITPQTNLDLLLNEAVEEPILLERNGVVFHLKGESDASQYSARNDHVLPSPEDAQMLIDRLVQRREATVSERRFVEDSTEIIRVSRAERTAQLLRASGSLTRDDPVWWEVARYTMEHFTRVRDAIFGDRKVEGDSTEILRQTREQGAAGTSER
jgi:hypothetical protein